jgi:glucose-1-phosphate cytidylyltransferase
MQGVILCGGRGTRIRDVAADIPKPRNPIGNRPIVWYILLRQPVFERTSPFFETAKNRRQEAA